MADSPWLTIIGFGEDGADGLLPATRETLERAEIIMAPARHLGLLPPLSARLIEWPVPFSAGVSDLLNLRGQNVVVLASGDPFWFGAGSVLARHLDPGEWIAIPALPTVSLAASRLGWSIETTLVMGLHASPFSRLRPHFAPGARAILLLRDGDAVKDLAQWLTDQGFGDTCLHVMEALGGPRERLRKCTANSFDLAGVTHPVCAGIELAGDGSVIPVASGRPDALFDNDGQITKRPIRALTLSALAPRAGETLWDIGGGSGSIAIEWLLSHATTHAITIEQHPNRAARIRQNADRLGVDRLQIVTGTAPDALRDLPLPDAVFIGGGLSADLLNALRDCLRPGTRAVANAVTLESEATLAQVQGMFGGDLLRIELAHAAPLGSRRGWQSAYPVVQWSVTL